MGIFGNLFDFNRDGKVDLFEMEAGLQMTASSRKEAIMLTGDDTFYTGDDYEDEEDELEAIEDDLLAEGIDLDDLDDMDEEELDEMIEELGYDSDDYDSDDF